MAARAGVGNTSCTQYTINIFAWYSNAKNQETTKNCTMEYEREEKREKEMRIVRREFRRKICNKCNKNRKTSAISSTAAVPMHTRLA